MLQEMADICEKDGVYLPPQTSIPDMAKQLSNMTKSVQNSFWQKLGKVTAAVDAELIEERSMQHEIPNKWAQLLRNHQLKRLSLAAEKYFRKKLRQRTRQVASTGPAEIEVIEISDDDTQEVIEILEEVGGS